jgi:hypothetical protein
MTKRDFHKSVWSLMEGHATDWLDTLAVQQLRGCSRKRTHVVRRVAPFDNKNSI